MGIFTSAVEGVCSKASVSIQETALVSSMSSDGPSLLLYATALY